MPFKSLLNNLFNIKENIYHHTTTEEINLIKNTHLFDKIDTAHFKEMIATLKLIKYSSDEVIFSEGNLGDALYIITEGSVRVFTRDVNGEKITLARLKQGDYFGEQAFLGEAYKSRNASIEAINETTLIKIEKEYFLHALEQDVDLKERLKKSGYQQALNILSLSTGFYSSFDAILTSTEHPVIELTKNHTLFNVGDKSENVYILLEGEVQLQISHNDNTVTKIVLHKGHLFGELGVLQNKPRSATAITLSNAKLMVLTNEEFKQYVEKSPQLKYIFSSLENVYRLPMKGTIEQYHGHIKDMGSTITNVYKMNDGRSIISSYFVHKDLFTMSSATTLKGKHYDFVHDGSSLELQILNDRLIGIEAYGKWEELPLLCKLILDNEPISNEELSHFKKTGRLRPELPKSADNDEIICECFSIKRHKLQELINKGITDLTTLSNLTGIATSCRGCINKVVEMLG